MLDVYKRQVCVCERERERDIRSLTKTFVKSFTQISKTTPNL